MEENKSSSQTNLLKFGLDKATSTILGHFYYQFEESYKSSMTDVFEPSENGPSATKVGRAQSGDECQKFIALP
jgi:hypothetical protein